MFLVNLALSNVNIGFKNVLRIQNIWNIANEVIFKGMILHHKLH